MKKWIVVVAALLGVAGVGVGAYHAHGLEKSLAEQMLDADVIAKRLDQCEVAVRYHMLHVLALLVLGAGTLRPSKRLAASAVFMLLGIALFSGGLYSMAFAGQMGHWAIVPLGGLSFMVGWLCLAAAALSLGSPSGPAADAS